eukprot:7391541-Prymnesium_polylepis.2
MADPPASDGGEACEACDGDDAPVMLAAPIAAEGEGVAGGEIVGAVPPPAAALSGGVADGDATADEAAAERAATAADCCSGCDEEGEASSVAIGGACCGACGEARGTASGTTNGEAASGEAGGLAGGETSGAASSSGRASRAHDGRGGGSRHERGDDADMTTGWGGRGIWRGTWHRQRQQQARR